MQDFKNAYSLFLSLSAYVLAHATYIAEINRDFMRNMMIYKGREDIFAGKGCLGVKF